MTIKKVFVITSQRTGTACEFLNQVDLTKFEIFVIYTLNKPYNKKKYFSQKLKKLFKKGPSSIFIGRILQKWYTVETEKYLHAGDLFDVCTKRKITIKQVEITNKKSTYQLIQNFKPDIGLSLGNGFLSPNLFTIPFNGMINIHHETLPEFKNAQSIIWQLYEKSKETGFTIHKINEIIDGGEIIIQKKIPIQFKPSLKETVAWNYAQLIKLSIGAVLDVLKSNTQVNLKAEVLQNKHYTTPNAFQFLNIYIKYRLLS